MSPRTTSLRVWWFYYGHRVVFWGIVGLLLGGAFVVGLALSGCASKALPPAPADQGPRCVSESNPPILPSHKSPDPAAPVRSDGDTGWHDVDEACPGGNCPVPTLPTPPVEPVKPPPEPPSGTVAESPHFSPPAEEACVPGLPTRGESFRNGFAQGRKVGHDEGREELLVEQAKDRACRDKHAPSWCSSPFIWAGVTGLVGFIIGLLFGAAGPKPKKE